MSAIITDKCIKRRSIILGLFCLCFVYYTVDSPYSLTFKYFHSSADIMNHAVKMNSARNQRALDYFNDLNAQRSKQYYKQHQLSETLDLLIFIITISRPVTGSTSNVAGYLTQTAASVDRLLKLDKHFGNKFLFVCNVHNEAMAHTEAVYLKKYIPFLEKNGTNNIGLNITNRDIPIVNYDKNSKDNKIRIQESLDYSFCLNQAFKLNSKFILVLEDDVIPYKDMFNVLKYILDKKKRYTSSERNLNDAILKLYYPTKWQGFAWEWDRQLELISLGSIGGGSFVIIQTLLGNRHQRRSKMSCFIYGFVLSVIASYFVGRQNMLKLRRISEIVYKFGPSPGCCTQAMLYSRHVLPNLTHYLLTHTSINKDLAIDDFVRRNAYPYYHIEPNLFQHIGMKSSLSNGTDDAEDYYFV